MHFVARGEGYPGASTAALQQRVQGPRPISAAAKLSPTLSLSLPTVQGRNSTPEESLGFLPAGVFCDPRAVFTWALDEQALTCP